MILASAMSSPEVVEALSMAKWVGVFALLFGVYMKVRTWEKSLKGDGEARQVGPQPFEVTLREKGLTKADHDALCGPLHQRVGVLESDVRAIRKKMDADKNELLTAGEERAKDLHKRIDGIPHQVIALLKDTKGLIK